MSQSSVVVDGSSVVVHAGYATFGKMMKFAAVEFDGSDSPVVVRFCLIVDRQCLIDNTAVVFQGRVVRKADMFNFVLSALAVDAILDSRIFRGGNLVGIGVSRRVCAQAVDVR